MEIYEKTLKEGKEIVEWVQKKAGKTRLSHTFRVCRETLERARRLRRAYSSG